jgi:hypothetical protein
MTGSLAARFTEALEDFGPVPIWWWSGAPLEPDRLRWQMERLVEGGVRQAVVLNLAPTGPLYGCLADEPALFTEAWWDVFLGVCADAAELGFRLWFYDQLGFSGADFQGRVLAREAAFRGESLGRTVLDADGPAAVTPPAGTRALAGFVVVDGELPELVPLVNGRLEWNADRPARLVLAHAEPQGFDYLSPTACEALLDAVHGEFERRVGHLFGSVVVGSFQDELPSLPSWAPAFAREFRSRRGYALEPLLLHLWEDLGEQTGRVRADYQRTRAELGEEAFFRPLHEWHEKRGLMVGCDQQHPARAGYPLEATQQYGDYLRTHRWFSAPGSDHWGDATVHSSLAHLYDRPRTWVEAFHSTGWGGTIEETLDWLLPWLRAGANLFDPHAVYYAMPGDAWEWAPPSTCWRQPYWRHYPVFAETVARLCAALTWGDHACDVGVLFPTATAQSELEVDRPEALLGSEPGTSAAQDLYLELVGRMHWFEPVPGVLDRAGIDLDVLDDDSVVRGSVVDGRLVVAGESYAAVVLPGCHVLEEPTAVALRTLASSGGTVVQVGDGPELPGALRCATAEEVPAALAGMWRRVVADAPTLLRTQGDSGVLLVLAGSATVQPEGRRWREEGYAFDPARYAKTATVSVSGLAEPVAVWDPETATCHPLPVRRERGRIVVDVPFTTLPCALVVYGPEALSLPVATSVGETEDVARLEDWTAELLPWRDDPWEPAGRDGELLVHHLEHESDGTWEPALVTFGSWGRTVGPVPVERLPQPGAEPDESWRDVRWSRVQGAAKPGDPKGFLPEEFLDLGEADEGHGVHLRFVVRPDRAQRHVVVGSSAEVCLWWNGRPVQLEQGPYYARGAVEPTGGDDVLEVRLVARAAGPLRASWVLREDDADDRPEWVTGSAVVERRGCPGGRVQLGTIGRVSLEVDGVEVARHGETDNYAHVAHPRVRRYDLPAGEVVRLRLHEPRAAAVLDGAVVTDASWTTARCPAQLPHDPRWVHLAEREHPLATLPRVVVGERGPERFRFRLPPGARSVCVPAGAQVEVEGRAAHLDGEEHVCEPVPAGTWCTVVLPPCETARGGARFDEPVRVRLQGSGGMPLGDWQDLGLQDHSGGLRYRAVAPCAADVLDLGEVRGSVDVYVDGAFVGCRAWSPYAFDVRGRLQPGPVVEVDVFNTLGPHQAAVSRTPWVLPGQARSGLFGPVALRRATEGGQP